MTSESTDFVLINAGQLKRGVPTPNEVLGFRGEDA